MRDLITLEAFVRVAEAESFASGAARLGVSTSAASKAVARLERELGVKLLNRTTRTVALTVEGERVLASARRVLDAADALSNEVHDTLEAPRGRLVVSAPAVFGRLWLTEQVLAFMASFPGVEVELMFDDRMVDLAAEGVDVAIRIGELSDSTNVVARKLFDDATVSVASPAYVERFGEPERPDALDRHRGIHYRVRGTGRLFPFVFDMDGGAFRCTLSPVLVCNSVDTLNQAAQAGIGIAQLPEFLAREPLARGALVELLRDYRFERFPYSILYLDRRLVPPRVRAFVDWLVAQPRPDGPGL